MAFKSYKTHNINGWNFKISTDDYLKSVMLFSFHQKRWWTNVRFFKDIDDAMSFAEYLNVQGTLLDQNLDSAL